MYENSWAWWPGQSYGYRQLLTVQSGRQLMFRSLDSTVVSVPDSRSVVDSDRLLAPHRAV